MGLFEEAEEIGAQFFGIGTEEIHHVAALVERSADIFADAGGEGEMIDGIAHGVFWDGEVSTPGENEDAHSWIRSESIGEAIFGGDVATLEGGPFPGNAI